MLRIGLTGGMGTGKSTVAELLRARGLPVLDLDAVAREVVAPGSPGLAAVVGAFGPDVLGPDGGLDRAALRARVLAVPADRERLEAITWPLIAAASGSWLLARAAEGRPAAVVDAAKMIESGSWRGYDALLVVSCPPALQQARISARDGHGAATVAGFLAAQMPLAAKERAAMDHPRGAVIWNAGGLADLERAVDGALAALRVPVGAPA